MKNIERHNSLQSRNHELAEQWHPTKNEKLIPSQVTTYSNKKVWWECSKGHEWMATVASRSMGNNCPYCSGKKVIPGETDLATKNPELAKEWHSTKNGDLLPSQIAAFSHKKISWKCSIGHEWMATVTSRSMGNNCPYCSGQKVIPGETDLATKNPELAIEWHPTKNKKLLPSQVAAGSDEKVWWECFKGHEWMATVANRSNGTNCPYCSGKRIILGETDLATKNPDIAKEWHSINNGDLLPSQVAVFSHKKSLVEVCQRS